MPLISRRPALVIGLGLTLLLLLLAIVTGLLVVRSREQLLDQLAAERARSVADASLRMEESLQDVADDVGFATRLVATADGPEQRRELLATLVGSVRAYRGAFLVAEDGTVVEAVGDPRHPEVGLAELQELAAQAARDALAPGAEGVQVSLPSTSPEAGWLRAFAVRLPPGAAPDAAAVALVADSALLLAPLSLLASEEATSLLVLGPHGRVVPVSSPELADRLAAGQLDGVRSRVHGPAGGARLGAREAAATGFPRADLLLSWRQVGMPGGDAWTVLTLSSTEAVRTLETELMLRFVGGAALAGALLLAAGLWALRAARRAAAMAERLRVADALAQLRERSERTLAHIPTAVLLLDAEGRVVDANPAARERFGRPQPGSDLRAAFPQAAPTAVAELQELLVSARTEGRTRELAEVRLDLDGGEGTWHVHAVALDHATDDLAALLVLDDLTELAALRQRLIRTEKLATVGELAAGIAHEIGTPLGVIRGRAEYIRGKLGEDHPQAAGLSVIVEQIERVVRTIRALLDFSRADPARVGEVRLADVVDRTAALMAMACEAAGVELLVERVDLDLCLRADADQLEQVLVNLTKNAIDASPRGSRIVLRAGRGADGQARIEVVDQGHGIPASDRHRVFDPFYTTRKRGQGTGLGLAIVLQVVRAHGAALELDSAPGRGTRAIVDWPLAA